MGLHNKIDWPVEQMRQWYEVERKTVEEIGQLLGRSGKVVNKACKRFGFAMRRRGPKNGPEHPGWKGGRHPDKAGYILLYRPEHPEANSCGYVREHRLVAEQMLGRRLLPTEVVHHKNDVPDDNRPENLQVFDTNADHLRVTLAGKCPQWSPEGRQRILESVRRGGRSTRRRRQEQCDSACSESPRRCSGETHRGPREP
jgi:HNH endonuclease